jgi:hypothetical protein
MNINGGTHDRKATLRALLLRRPQVISATMTDATLPRALSLYEATGSSPEKRNRGRDHEQWNADDDLCYSSGARPTNLKHLGKGKFERRSPAACVGKSAFCGPKVDLTVSTHLYGVKNIVHAMEVQHPMHSHYTAEIPTTL